MIDLHTHSTASDGSLSPEALVDRAAALGLTGLALTDHDTLAGLASARARARQLGLRFMNGIELSSQGADGADIHILGYGVDDAADSPLQRRCAALRQARRARADRMVRQLRQAGVPVTLAAVLREAGEGSVGRPHVARALLAGGWAASLGEAFQLWLTPGRPGYVPSEKLSPAEALALIAAAAGVSVLAHPATISPDLGVIEALARELQPQGLGGLEAYWAKHTAAIAQGCEDIARRLDLVATGGSDFHGANKPGIELGMAAAGRRLQLDRFTALQARRPPRAASGA